jgi:two-component system, NtrC family, response regulator HydG
LGVTPEAMNKMVQYHWPGNVRELRNAVEYAFVLCPSGGIDGRHLPPKILGAEPQCPPPAALAQNSDERLKRELIQVLRQTEGNQSEAARVLGVSRITVWKRIKKFGIDLKTEIH